MPALTRFDEFKKRARSGRLAVIKKQLLADTETPVSVFARIRPNSLHPFLLESVEGGEKLARYSFIGYEIAMRFTARRDQWQTEVFNSGWNEFVPSNSSLAAPEALDSILSSIHIDDTGDGPRLNAGAVGYIGYDAIRMVENLPNEPQDDTGIPDIQLGFYNGIIAFDNHKHNLVISYAVKIDDDSDLQQVYDAAVARISEIEAMLKTPLRLSEPEISDEGNWASNIEQARYENWVEKSREYIFAGDIFQVVLSQRFQTPYSGDPFSIYRMLRILNPSPYLYFIDQGDLQLIGSSPEMLIRVDDGIVETRPIAGTRKRGGNEAEDQQLAQELLADQKERAEHVMLVDLGRNDVGRISKAGTVTVPELMRIERYSHVMHIVSEVRGELAENISPLEAFMACFPAGTVSGAPKIRAMEIIDEMETVRRGVYAGAIGYFDFSGNMDWCIAIRTIVLHNNTAYIQAGAGLVADSVPVNEFNETVNKSAGMKLAVQIKEV